MTLIIFSPSKEMDTIVGNGLIPQSDPVQAIIKELALKDTTELEKLFKCSAELAQDIYHRYQVINKKTARPAYQVYQGLAFRQIKWDKIDLNYAKNHLKILSALYGPISPIQPINPYRLDFNTSLKIKNQSLKSLWKAHYNKAFEEQTVINLASNEFASLLDPKKMQLIQINFYKDIELSKKAPSATSKKLRGALLNYLLQTKSLDLNTFKAFKAFEYSYANGDFENKEINYCLN
ncbi:YaaA family protein [Facklamia sp. P12932]|uniref:YaaA family protein n=1 Tax=Facklamia sp. P12932 TaxID=3421947 RepID=UPI003D172EA5